MVPANSDSPWKMYGLLIDLVSVKSHFLHQQFVCSERGCFYNFFALADANKSG